VLTRVLNADFVIDLQIPIRGCADRAETDRPSPADRVGEAPTAVIWGCGSSVWVTTASLARQRSERRTARQRRAARAPEMHDGGHAADRRASRPISASASLAAQAPAPLQQPRERQRRTSVALV
jgi:hypothetical protein